MGPFFHTWPQIEVRMMDTRDAEHELNIEITENECRKEFTWTERLEYARRLERIESINAKERMLAGKAINPSANLREGETRNTTPWQICHRVRLAARTAVRGRGQAEAARVWKAVWERAGKG